MIYNYIVIDIKAVTNEYLTKVCPEYGIEPKDRSLIYSLKDGNYYHSSYPTDVWNELTCETQEEFINTVAQHKLERIL